MAQAIAHSRLYRTARHAVIWAGLAFILAHLLFAQRSAGTKKPTGPRALGLLEIAPSGKVTLLPVTIMIDGEFYDASAYKASPVPLALYTDTVYEGVKTGVSQGLFTVTTAQHGETIWRGLGKWQSADSIAEAEAKKKASAAAAERAKKVQDNSDGPPVLKRPSATEPTPSPAASAPPPATGSSPDDPYGPPTLKRPNADPSPSASSAPSAPPAGSPAPAAPGAAPQTPPSGAAPAPPQATPPPANDPNVPTLRRGKAAAAKEEAREAAATAAEPAAVKASAAKAPGKAATVTMTATATSNGMQLIPAISDAAGPDPRPYAYGMKPDEEAKLRDKILALAAIEVRGRAKDLGLATVTAPAATTAASSSGRNSAHAGAAKPPAPRFDTVQLRVFDLSNNNEPVLVLTANARLPQTVKGGATAADVQYIVTLVAREDIYGDLHKAYSNVTDAQHLDVSPQMEFIDAVDVDGDGRGELLFRQVSDSGKAFVVYRVIGDQVWPLFQGKLG
jgi:hypothetical protein